MKPRLRSNFMDWYDRAFANAYGPTFERFDRTGMSRPQMFDLLARAGHRVPARGRVRDLTHPLFGGPLSRLLVVHHDVFAHRGEGKELLPYAKALESFPDAFAVPWIGWRNPESTRVLHVGRRCFQVEYQSNDAWRSNYGDVTVESKQIDPVDRRGFEWPLFAIDFVHDGDGHLYAIDLNTSPGLSPVQGLITADEVVGEIEWAMDTAKAVEEAVNA